MVVTKASTNGLLSTVVMYALPMTYITFPWPRGIFFFHLFLFLFFYLYMYVCIKINLRSEVRNINSVLLKSSGTPVLKPSLWVFGQHFNNSKLISFSNEDSDFPPVHVVADEPFSGAVKSLQTIDLTKNA